MVSLDTLKQNLTERDMASEVVRSKEVRGDSRSQHAEDPAKRSRKTETGSGRNGKAEGVLHICES